MAGTSFSSGPGGRGGIVGINVTPMVDIVLVLLVIMMVSANFIVAESMNVDLPKASNGEGSASTPAIVTVTAEGAYGWQDSPIDVTQLAGKLREAWTADNDVNLVISADGAARHAAVVQVIDLAKAAGITHYAIGVEQPD
ncbi:MAG: biopolymer transporter ExbD [Myxococcota bacterium]